MGRSNDSSESGAEQYMTVAEAQAYLGVGNKKVARLLKEGELTATPDPLDKRVKLVKRSDVEALKARSVVKGAA